MDFLPKTANLQGGDTRKTPNLANTREDWFSLYIHLKTGSVFLSIPLNPFQPKYPMGSWVVICTHFHPFSPIFTPIPDRPHQFPPFPTVTHPLQPSGISGISHFCTHFHPVSPSFTQFHPVSPIFPSFPHIQTNMSQSPHPPNRDTLIKSQWRKLSRSGFFAYIDRYFFIPFKSFNNIIKRLL